MAIAPNAVIDCQSGGSTTNGGFFDSTVTNAGTDYSLSTSPVITLTDVACTQNSTTITSAAGLFTAAMVGNGAWLSAGTNFVTTKPYYITAVNSATEAVLDETPATAGNGTGGNMKVGGSWALPTSSQWSRLVGGNTVYFKASATYTLTGDITNPAAPTGQSKIVLRAYTTTHGDYVARSNFPKIAQGTYSIGINTFFDIKDIWYDSSRSAGITLSIVTGSLDRCKITNTASNSGSVALAIVASTVLGCEIRSNYGSAVAFSSGSLINSKMHTSVTGLLLDTSGHKAILRNVIRGNTTGIKFASTAARATIVAWNNIYNNATGIDIGTTKFQTIHENVVHTCSTVGITDSATNTTIDIKRNVFYNCATNATNITLDSSNIVDVDPLWTDPANDDYTISAGTSPAIGIGYDFTDLGLIGNYKWNAGLDQDDNAAGGGTACHMSAF